ncbi:MAG: hypothetical protein EZS28_005778 [Streblomastix strix]|uniref:Uncharacterized protein n=1 Tax=Streblomastix strix TaxID=222440 RepID=A0A5J4WUQ7_9EUKA|nr:MAG: hypothetical protein EZS28_005778 [Streblomastix strix]
MQSDGMIKIVDDWHVNSIIDGMKSISLVQDVVQKRKEAIGDGIQPNDPMNNQIFVPLRASYFVKEGLICTFHFQAEINGNDTPEVVVNQGFWYYPMDLYDFSGSYLIDPQPQESNQSNITSNEQPISHIDSVIMQHDILPPMPIPPSVFP